MKIKIVTFIVLFNFIVFFPRESVALHAVPDSCPPPIYGSAFQMGVSVQFGIMQGLAREYAYDGDYRLSRLDWELGLMYYMGAVIGLRILESWHIAGGFWSGFSNRIGKVEDSDWLNYDGQKTNYSRHDNLLQRALFMDVNAGYTLELFEHLQIVFMFGCTERVVKMRAEDGYLEYPPGSPRVPVYGPAITYRQRFRFPYTAIGMGYRGRLLVVSVYGYYSPLVSCEAIDNHHKRTPPLDFHDSLKNGNYHAVMGTVSLNLYSLCLSLQGLYSRIGEFRGETYSVDTSTGIKSAVSSNGAAASFEAWNMTLSVGIIVEW